MRDMTLGELLSETGGSVKTGPFGTTLKASEYSISGPPVISVGEVGYGSLRLHERTPRVPKSVVERLPEYVLRPGDIVFGRKGAVDRSAWLRPAEDGYFLGSDGIRVRIGEGADSRFVAYQLQSQDLRDWLMQHAAGTTMASLNQPTLERVPLRIPALQEQRGIAEVLGALDDKIAANTHLGCTGWALARAGFTQLQQGVTQDVAVGEILTLEYGKSLPASARMPGDVAVFGSGGSVGVHDTALVNRPGVVIGRKGSAGLVHWASGPHFPIDTTFFAVPAAADVPLTFCYFALASLRLDEMNSDSAVPGLNRGAAHAARFRLPEAEARMAFDAMATPLFALATQAERESTHLAKLRDALLPQLMSGKIRVKDAERVVEGVV